MENLVIHVIILNIMARFNSNIEICNKLTDFFNKTENKQIRFCQALQILGINHQLSSGDLIDNFNEESLTTLKKIIEYEKATNSK